jgi:hypothetical protein
MSREYSGELQRAAALHDRAYCHGWRASSAVDFSICYWDGQNVYRTFRNIDELEVALDADAPNWHDREAAHWVAE